VLACCSAVCLTRWLSYRALSCQRRLSRRAFLMSAVPFSLCPSSIWCLSLHLVFQNLSAFSLHAHQVHDASLLSLSSFCSIMIRVFLAFVSVARRALTASLFRLSESASGGGACTPETPHMSQLALYRPSPNSPRTLYACIVVELHVVWASG